MAIFTIFEFDGTDRIRSHNVLNAEHAIDLAKEWFDAIEHSAAEPGAHTIGVENEEGKVIFSLTQRRIECEFLKQTWGGRKGDTAIEVGTETLDVTDYVLSLPYDRFVAIEDNDESSDEIGRAHTDWKGPCEATVKDSVLDYFGVFSLDDVTPEALAHAREAALSTAPSHEDEVLDVTLQVKVRKDGDAQVSSDAFDCSVRANAPGLRVLDVSIVSCEPAEPAAPRRMKP